MTSPEPAPFVDLETIRLTHEGVWQSNGQEITHREQCRAFARHLGRDDVGWFIAIGKDFKRIEVEDTAFFVEGLTGSAERGYEVLLSDDSRENLDPATLIYQPGRLTCRIRGKSTEAKFLTSTYLEILARLEEDAISYFLILGGQRVTLANKDELRSSTRPG